MMANKQMQRYALSALSPGPTARASRRMHDRENRRDLALRCEKDTVRTRHSRAGGNAVSCAGQSLGPRLRGDDARFVGHLRALRTAYQDPAIALHTLVSLSDLTLRSVGDD